MEDDYRSDFEAPEYTVVDVKRVGDQVIRTVVMDGEVQEFVASRTLYLEGNVLTALPPDATI